MLLQRLFVPRLLDNIQLEALRGKQTKTTLQQTMERHPRFPRLKGLLSPDRLHSTVSEGLAGWSFPKPSRVQGILCPGPLHSAASAD